MLTPITITRTETEYLDLDDLTEQVEKAILDEEGTDLEELISDIIDYNYFNYDWYNDEIKEFSSIYEYVESHLSEEALAKLDN